MGSSIESSWARIEAWLKQNAPDAAESIGPPVPEQAIVEAEAQLGFALPDELKALYRTVGLSPDKAELPSICIDAEDQGPFAHYLLTIEEMLDEWGTWKELTDLGEFDDRSPDRTDPGVVEAWWNTKWVPFAGDGGGGCIVVDLGPAEGGTIGQVVTHCHESGDHRVLARSLSEYFEQIADGMESGQFEYTDDYGMMRVEG